jgi:hypothetical protein
MRIVLQNSFWITGDKFSGLWARRSNNRAGTTATGDELTGNFGSAPEGTSIGDCRLVALFAEKSLKVIFGVLQHYHAHNGLKSDIARGRKSAMKRHAGHSAKSAQQLLC